MSTGSFINQNSYFQNGVAVYNSSGSPFSHSSLQPSTPKYPSSILVAWEPPPNPFFKLNFDSLVHGTYVIAGIIIKDSDEHLLKTATLNLGSSSVYVAETPPFSKGSVSLSKITFVTST